MKVNIKMSRETRNDAVYNNMSKDDLGLLSSTGYFRNTAIVV
jgi:hypothetical protein